MAAERPDDPHALLLLGDMLRQRERFVEAVPVYDQAIALKEPLPQRYWRVLYARGIALERAKLWPRAEADFVRALEMEPDQPLVLNYLGYSWVEQGERLEEAQDMIRRLAVKTPSENQHIGAMSGGNAQKVVLARQLVERPQVLVLAEPTQGVDVGAKEEIHRIIAELADAGTAVLVVTSDLPEAIRISDRLQVVRNGTTTVEFGPDATQVDVLAAAAGDVDHPPSPAPTAPDTQSGSTEHSKEVS